MCGCQICPPAIRNSIIPIKSRKRKYQRLTEERSVLTWPMKFFRPSSGIGSDFNDKADISRPTHHRAPDLFPMSLNVAASVTDKTYAIVFITALGLSALTLCLCWYLSRDPIFAKDILKLPRFRRLDYQTVSSRAENSNGIDHNSNKNAVPERLTGWRLRLGVLQSLVLLSLVVIHTVILMKDCPTFLRIVFVVYWVYQLIPKALIIGSRICLQLPSFPPNSVSPIAVQHRLCAGSCSAYLPRSNGYPPASPFEIAYCHFKSISAFGLGIKHRHNSDCCGQYHTVAASSV